MEERRLKNVLGVIMGVPIIVVCNTVNLLIQTPKDIKQLFYNLNHDDEEESE